MAQTARQIVTELHDEPHLAGRRITVRRLQALVEDAATPAPAVAEQFDLAVADVYAALHYYHTHPAEMAAAEHKRHTREKQAIQAGGRSLAELRDDDE